MSQSSPHRDLLIADLALVLGIAPARDVALALQRFWERKDEAGASLLGELRQIARLGTEDILRLEAEAEATIAAAGEARLALGARGGMDRSIHLELSVVEPPLVQILTELGVGARSPLRIVPAERYIDFSAIGRGGMGVVYLALDTELNRRVALKIVRPDRVGLEESESSSPFDLTPPGRGTPASEAFRILTARFLQEAWVTGGLEHPSIVPVYELGQTPAGVPYYTMRFIRGQRTLETAIQDAGSLQDRLALLEPFLKVCDAVSYAHSRRVIHRDLKPENIGLGEFGEVVVLDWGLAKLKDQPDLTGSRWQDRIQEFRDAEDLQTVAGALGTPGYMAPEAVLGHPDDVDEASDVYSLGAMLFRILTGQLPHDFGSFAELVGALSGQRPRLATDLCPDTPGALAEVCSHALSSDKRSRVSSPQALAQRVRSWLRESALEQEAAGHAREARMALRSALDSTGEDRLRHADRALLAAQRAAELRPDDTSARRLIEECVGTRDLAIESRTKAARRSLLRRVAAVVLVLGLAGSILAAVLIERQRNETEIALEGLAGALSENREIFREARALALTNLSAAAQGRDPQEALLLAREAIRLSDSAQVIDRMHEALVGCHEVLSRAEESLADLSITRTRILWKSHDAKRVTLTDTRGTVIASLSGHTAPITVARFSPSGAAVFTAAEDGSARLWTMNGELVASLDGHESEISAATFSRDGALVATVSREAARLWSATGDSLAVLPTKRCDAPVFSPGGDWILTNSRAKGGERVLQIWGLDGRELAAHRFDECSMFVGLSPRGTEFLSLTRSEAIGTRTYSPLEQTENRVALTLWVIDRLPEGNLRCSLKARVEFAGREIDAAFSPAGDRVLAVPSAGPPQLWNPDTGELLRPPGQIDALSLVGGSFAPSGQSLVLRARGGSGLIWTPDSGDSVGFRGHDGGLRSATFSPDGSRVITTGADGTARIWGLDGVETTRFAGCRESARFVADRDLVLVDDRALLQVQEAELARFGKPDGSWVLAVDIAPSGDRALTVIAGTARIWSLEGELLASLALSDTDKMAYHGFLDSARFSPDGNYILTWSDRAARLWNSTGEIIVDLIAHEGPIRDAAFSPDGTTVLTASEDGLVILWSMSGDIIGDLAEHEDGVASAVFSPDGLRILTASWDGSARVYTRDGKMELLLPHGDPKWSKADTHYLAEVHCAAFSPDGKLIVTGGGDRTTKIWDLGGKLLREMKSRGSDEICHVAFSPLGDRVLSVNRGDRDQVEVWDISGKRIAVLDNGPAVDHEERMSWWPAPPPKGIAFITARFSPRGDRILTASYKNPTCRVWTADGDLIATLHHRERLVDAVFSPTGDRILTASMDSTAWLWLVYPRDLLRLADRKIRREFTTEEQRRYGSLLETSTSTDRLTTEQRR